jgi:hypothetical protein
LDEERVNQVHVRIVKVYKMETKINKGAHKKSMMVLKFTLLAGGGYVFGRLVGDLMLGPYVC